MEPNATLLAVAAALITAAYIGADLFMERYGRTVRRLRSTLATKFASRTRAAAGAAGATNTPSWKAAAIVTMHAAVAEELAAYDLPPISVETIQDAFEHTHGQVLPFAAKCAGHVVDCLPKPTLARFL